MPYKDIEQRKACQKRNYPKHKTSKRNYEFKRKFGITLEDKHKMFEEQQHKCAICGNNMILGGQSKFSACIDHNHINKIIRGLLCNNCNAGIGFLQDDPNILISAIHYLLSRNNMYSEWT